MATPLSSLVTVARQPRREEKPFDDEDDEVRSISDAGSLDSIDSDHELGPEVEHPMSRMATAAMEDMARGQKLSMHETMSQLRDEYGANTEPEPPIDPGEARHGPLWYTLHVSSACVWYVYILPWDVYPYLMPTFLISATRGSK